MPGYKTKSHKRHRGAKLSTNTADKKIQKHLDTMAEYEAFIQDVPKVLREAILAGKDATAIYEQFSDIAAVRVVQILMTEGHSATALAAAKELLDRTYGKATERKEVRHTLDQVSDDELDAILISEMAELEEGKEE